MRKIVVPIITKKGIVNGYHVMTIHKKPKTAEYTAVCNLLPGLPMGYSEDFFKLVETQKAVPISSFYDPRQSYPPVFRKIYIALLL